MSERRVLAHPSLVDRLLAVARRLESLRRPAEAAEVLEVAAAISPQPDSLRREAMRLREEEPADSFERELKRRNLEASHAVGMGHIFLGRGETERAVELFDLAKLRTPFHYLAYAASGYLALRLGDAETALQEFTQARRLNPLDLRLAVEASRSALQLGKYEAALEHAVDALLLAQWCSEQDLEQERRRVETLAQLCALPHDDLALLVREHAAALQKACDHIALSQAKMFSGARLPRRRRDGVVDLAKRNLIERSGELRALPLFRHLGDDQLISLARLLEPCERRRAEVIFREGANDRDVFLLRQGRIDIGRRTPAGTQILATLGPGALLGEVSYIDGGQRSATAYAEEATRLHRLPAAALERAAREDRDLAVGLLWSFWQSLADKVRAANAHMGELFSSGGPSPVASRTDGGRPVRISEEDKLELLREQGLSAQELRLLATYSREERFEDGEMIFAEGERGDFLSIVVDGQVRISRLVPGMGEECLAILGRGEVFGEIALVDDQARSADARAHTGGCTIFSVSRSLLQEVLSMDPDAAIQFLGLLCRLLCRRLRAMNDRLVVWRVMASHQ